MTENSKPATENSPSSGSAGDVLASWPRPDCAQPGAPARARRSGRDSVDGQRLPSTEARSLAAECPGALQLHRSDQAIVERIAACLEPVAVEPTEARARPRPRRRRRRARRAARTGGRRGPRPPRRAARRSRRARRATTSTASSPTFCAPPAMPVVSSVVVYDPSGRSRRARRSCARAPGAKHDSEPVWHAGPVRAARAGAARRRRSRRGAPRPRTCCRSSRPCASTPPATAPEPRLARLRACGARPRRPSTRA